MLKTKNIGVIRHAASFTAALCLLLTVWTAGAAPRTSAQSPTPQSNRIGEIKMDSYDVMRLLPSRKAGTTTVLLTGPALVITSLRYRMASPRILLNFKGSKVTTGSASGGVQVTVKDASAGQTTTVTCDTANYTVGATAGWGRIDLKGTVRSKTYSPGFAQPLVSESESGFIEFTPDGPIVQLNKGSATVTPIEPTPAPKKP